MEFMIGILPDDKRANKSLQATRDGGLSLSRSRWLTDVTSHTISGESIQQHDA